MIQFRKLRKRAVTLIEMMIVMFLIALITGVVAYNYRGSLDQGKAFKTSVGIEKVETILNLEVAKNPGLKESISSDWQGIIRSSPLVHDVNALIRDGWGNDYTVESDENGTIRVRSQQYDDYKARNPSSF